VVETYLQVLRHADMRLLARIQNPARPREFFSALARGISAARLYRRLAVTHLGEVDAPHRVAHVAELLLTCWKTMNRGRSWYKSAKGRLRTPWRSPNHELLFNHPLSLSLRVQGGLLTGREGTRLRFGVLLACQPQMAR
jgi:hypothetical protein